MSLQGQSDFKETAVQKLLKKIIIVTRQFGNMLTSLPSY